MAPRLPSILAAGALWVVGVGCGSDGDDAGSSAADAVRTVPPIEGAASDAAAARLTGIGYFLSNDPAACTTHATPNHIESDYGGSLDRCEAVRRSNKLRRDQLSFASQAEVTGDEAKLGGRVLVTGQRFVIELVKVGESWRIDRIRGSQ